VYPLVISLQRPRSVAAVVSAVLADLASGDSLAPGEFTWHEGLDSVRADSLRGAYRVVGRLKLSGRTYDVPAGAVRLP
jgi:hypothetical protein